MSLTAILLLLLSALLHATWNWLLKRADEKYIASWWTVVIGGILSLPLLLWQGGPPQTVWPLLLLSVGLECLYFILLSYAYATADFSLVYPMARGTAPLFLTLWAWLGLGEQPRHWGWAGLALLLSGLLLLGWNREMLSQTRMRGLLAALGVALLISLYTLVDGIAVRRAPSLNYALGLFTLIPFALTPFALKRYGWERLRHAWQARSLTLIAIATLGTLAYLLALSAYRLAPLGYAGAIREVSVVFGAWLGWKGLGESQGRRRVLASALIFGGLVVLSRWG